MISAQADFLALLDRLRGQAEIAIDCEFHGEGRYHPMLCLVQIGAGDELAAVDPFAVDLTPLGEVLADPGVVKLFHAAENDIPLLARATGRAVENVFDTQLAAAFVGHGAAPSYMLLVERLCGVALSKRARFTDWSARPLSREQVAYALDDVRYLPRVADGLREELARRGRLGWAAMATAEMVAKAMRPRNRSRLYLKFRAARDMTSRQLAVLREVAAWRDQRAEEIDKPPLRVAPDEALQQIAFRPPRSAADLGRLRGLQGLGGAAAELFAAVRRGQELPDAECPPVLEAFDRDERSALVYQVLATALRVRADELEVAPSMIATRDHLEQLVSWDSAGRAEAPPDVARPEGWKRAAAGEMLLGVLEGRYSLRVDPASPFGVSLAPVGDPAP